MLVRVDERLDGLRSVETFQVKDGLVTFPDGCLAVLQDLAVFLAFAHFRLHFCWNYIILLILIMALFFILLHRITANTLL